MTKLEKFFKLNTEIKKVKMMFTFKGMVVIKKKSSSLGNELRTFVKKA